jgi:hypothetical protein
MTEPRDATLYPVALEQARDPTGGVPRQRDCPRSRAKLRQGSNKERFRCNAVHNGWTEPLVVFQRLIDETG